MKPSPLACTRYLLLLLIHAGLSATSARADGPFALSFDGTNDYVFVNHLNILNSEALTVTAWVKTTQTTGEVGIVNKYVAGSFNGWQVFLYNGSVRAWYFGGTTNYIWDGGRGLNGGPVADGAWHHVAFTVDVSGGRLYVDGALKDSRAWTGIPREATTTQELRLGSYPGNGFFKGTLDEVTIWLGAQPASWIQTNRDRGYISIENNLMVYLRLNEGTGAYVSDRANYEGSNCGLLTNGPTWVPGLILRPGILTAAATAITSVSATLQGLGNPDWTNGTGWFEWGATTSYGNTTPPQSIGNLAFTKNFTQPLGGLTNGVAYHFRAVASNSVGVSFGQDMSFVTTSTNMITARVGHSATLMPDGNVLVVGGQQPVYSQEYLIYVPATNAEVYAPATGTWTATAPPNTARFSHTACLLPTGQVLLAGGLDSQYNCVASTELYDPATRTWTPNGSMNTNRARHTATVLPSGKVLVIGGTSDYSFTALPVDADLYDPATRTWTAVGGPPFRRADHAAVLLTNGWVLITGGRSSQTTALASAEVYNPAGQIWGDVGNMTTNRHHHSATLLPNGKVLVVGGYNGAGAYISTAELYDPATGFWTLTDTPLNPRFDHTATLMPNGDVVAAGGYGSTGFLELYDAQNWITYPGQSFRDGTATLLPGGRALLAGGYDPYPSTSAQLFDINFGTCANNPPMPVARDSHTATLLPIPPYGAVLIAGGSTNNGSNPTATAQLYNTVSWSNTGSMTTNRMGHTATLLPNGPFPYAKVLVAGGFGSGSVYHATAELYDWSNGTWTATGSMSTNRRNHTATVLRNGKVLAAGGLTGPFGLLASAEIYDPATGTWSLTAPMNLRHTLHTATLLPSGLVLVAGGYATLSPTTACELYDLATGTWTLTGSMNVARADHTATLLPSGLVLVASGGTAELYDPDAGTWTPTGSMTTNRSSHTATLLPDGRVLAAGGRNALSTILSSAELYDPASGTWKSTSALHTSRYLHTATLLPNGRALIVGGFGPTSSTDLAAVELYDLGLGFSNSWQPQISGWSTPVPLGGKMVVTGSRFRGVSEASGGNGTQASPTDFPLVQLHSIQSERSVFLLSTNWSTNSVSCLLPTDFPPGYAIATLFVNAIPSAGMLMQVPVTAATPPRLLAPGILPDGSLQFSFTNKVGALFTGLAASNAVLPLSNWTAVGGVAEVSPGQFEFTDPQATNAGQRFYRVRSQ